MSQNRVANEIAHGKRLAAGVPEELWGWGTPAGRVRARRRAALILEHAGAGPGCRILEVGCGSGMFTELFAESGAEIVALDLSPELLALARSRGLPPERVRFVEQRFEELDQEASFDAVIGSSVLHHLDLVPALEKAFALLKPGGRLSFAEPNLLNPQVFVERRFRRWFPNVSPDETAFVRPRLRRQLAALGFEDVDIEPFDWLHPAVPESWIGGVSRLGRLLEHIWGLREFAGSLRIAARRPRASDGSGGGR
jgi:2-polyprenyl-3-methyl-5-hydroxy-6-metoxy-1,4-benzoquinol methylase